MHGFFEAQTFKDKVALGVSMVNSESIVNLCEHPCPMDTFHVDISSLVLMIKPSKDPSQW